MLFAQNAPAPGVQESLERCDRLISGAVENGDRGGAERWLSTCELPRDEAVRLLERRFVERWGEEGPPPLNPLDTAGFPRAS